MKSVSLYFCCSSYFLVLLHVAQVYTHGPGDHRAYSNVASTEQMVRPWTGGGSEFMRSPPVVPPYHVFPMFQHYPVPLVDMELFRPVSERRQLPTLLSSLLIPPVSPQRIQVSPVRNARGVEVWCGYSKVSVRVDKNLLGFRCSPSVFHLGTCPVSRFDKHFFYFHYDLNDCDSSLTMVNGQIVYSNTVSYTPEPQGTVIRALPLAVHIECLYNRFHYSYKMGFLPVLRERVFHKTFERRAKFTISVCNEHWERIEKSGSFVLGEPMYFEVTAAHASKHEWIFVDSCYATASKDPKSTPQHSVINNYGCMEDSRRQGSLSRFHQRHSNIIRFSVDAFLLPQVTDMHLYMHCSVSVHNSTSATAKSCTYNNAEFRWEELYSDSSVCDCCDSTCEIEADFSLASVAQSLITSKPWIVDYSQQSLQTKEEWVRVQEEDTVKFKSSKVIDAVETMTAEEQLKARKENKKISVKHSDVEVIVGTTATESKVEKGKVGVNAGRPMSASGTGVVKQSSTLELLEDVTVSGESGQNLTKEESSKDKIDLDDFEKNMQVRSTVPTQVVVDEEIFLNAKQEPAEWSEDKH